MSEILDDLAGKMDGAGLAEIEHVAAKVNGRIAEVASLLEEELNLHRSAEADHKRKFLTKHVETAKKDWTVPEKKSWAELEAIEEFEVMQLHAMNIKILKTEFSALTKALDLSRSLMATMRYSQPR